MGRIVLLGVEVLSHELEELGDVLGRDEPLDEFESELSDLKGLVRQNLQDVENLGSHLSEK